MSKMRMTLPEMERNKLVSLANKCILSEAGKPAIDYLKSDKRNFDDAAIKIAVDKFKIGYVPEGILNVNGFSHEFSGKIIFPIYDAYNNLIALSSRDFRSNAKSKFFHESFIKRNSLYGLNVAKKNIVRRRMAIIVEGEFDVQFSHIKGFDFTVGLLGSALGLSHVAILSRYCREIFLVLDGDTAGKNAMKKLLNNGLSDKLSACQYYNISIVPVYLPEGIDPDEFLRKKGTDAYIKLLRDSRKDKELLNGI